MFRIIFDSRKDMPDKIIVCSDCSQEFVHSEGAQQFYQEKGFTSDPKRCPNCRKTKKERFAHKNGSK